MSGDAGKWQFWIDRGGTFTDIVAKTPSGQLLTRKLLSESPRQYDDAAIEGIRRILQLSPGQQVTSGTVESVKMGTTVATNALLERTGEPTILVVTKGFRDALRIGSQNRPRLFDRHIAVPAPLYTRVIEVNERVDAHGALVKALDLTELRPQLQVAYDAGLRSLAVALMHAYRFPAHELAVERLATEIGYSQISVSHKVIPVMKFVSRSETTLVDAYLSPILRRYVQQVASCMPDVDLRFMQSNGGLTRPAGFHGKDAILSGPAGGIIGMVRSAQSGGFDKIIGFDMGGTSTDVSHFAGEFERELETQIAGVHLRTPIMNIHTVAAGGGSVLHFDRGRFRVGPDSAAADPGPASYRRGGPLTVTDCNVLLGRIQPAHFPKVFGADGTESLDAQLVREQFAALALQISSVTQTPRTPEEVANGFIEVAVRNMANAIRRVSVERGYDVTDYVLNTFGGAGGQHACQVADHLGMGQVFLHPLAGVLSAYGIGLADSTAIAEQSAEIELKEDALHGLSDLFGELEDKVRGELLEQNFRAHRIHCTRKVNLRYDGTDTALPIRFDTYSAMLQEFETAYRRRFSFLLPGRALVAGTVTVEATGLGTRGEPPPTSAPAREEPLLPNETVRVYFEGVWQLAPLYLRDQMRADDRVAGPALIVEPHSTTAVNPGWEAQVTSLNHLIMTRQGGRHRHAVGGTNVDPVRLEVFNSLFMSVAEQMGLRLQQSAHSVNIKERLDFSCAIFDQQGNLIANAPHIPVHLGSMGESIQTVIRDNAGSMRPGDAFAINDPYHGGTHLPDITVITPVFSADGKSIEFYVGSRGHHADIGGITPGSIPPHSTRLDQEGVLFTNWQLVDAGEFREPETLALLTSGKYPARNPQQNLADLRAQIAANIKGSRELHRMIEEFGLNTVRAYAQHVQTNGEEAVRSVIGALKDGSYRLETDSGAVIQVSVRVDHARRSAIIDFAGTSSQLPNNFNAPSSITVAAVLFVFRCLVEQDIPLNSGCLRPLEIIIPEGSMLNPGYPAAVVAGNVETSQCIANALFGALGVNAASQCTMNNFSFGAGEQYYETIAGGSGAGPGFPGADVVQTNMTNSRITDPEVLEFRFPVLVESFEIRPGSGGKGQWDGGCGASRCIRFLAPMSASILSNNRRVAPFGLCGGAPGGLGRNLVRRADGSIEHLPSCATAKLSAGDTFIIETPGGGGYGRP